MPDNDARVLEDAADAVTVIDLEYRAADAGGRLALKTARDEAFRRYAEARLKLLADGVICNDADVEEMTRLRQEVKQAADTQALVQAAVKLTIFLARIAAV